MGGIVGRRKPKYAPRVAQPSERQQKIMTRFASRSRQTGMVTTTTMDRMPAGADATRPRQRCSGHRRRRRTIAGGRLLDGWLASRTGGTNFDLVQTERQASDSPIRRRPDEGKNGNADNERPGKEGFGHVHGGENVRKDVRSTKPEPRKVICEILSRGSACTGEDNARLEYYFAWSYARAIAFITSAWASSASSQSPVLTHLPGSRSL